MKKEQNIDAKLVEQYQSGNSDALAELVKRWHLKFCKKALWIVKDPELAKDVAQECWKTVMLKISALNEPSSFGGWAYRIVYSKSLDALRHKSKERNQQHRYGKEQDIVEQDYDEKTALKQGLLKALQKLPEQQQIVIRLFYVEDYSIKEISKLLSVSIGTTKSRLFHAREKLKLTLKNKQYEN